VPTSPHDLEWFSIDEAWDTSPATPAAVARAFADCGAAGFASWQPEIGTEAVVAMGEDGAIGSGLDARALAMHVASATGATITWGPYGTFERNFVAGDDSRGPLDSTLAGRTVYVLPTTLERLGVRRALPRSKAVDPTPVMHAVADGRSVLIGDETLHGGWSWSRTVQPVIALSTYANGLVLRIWTPRGHQEGRRNQWRSAAPDLERHWWRLWAFGSPSEAGVNWDAALDSLQGERRLLSTIQRVFAEIGLESDAAGQLDALSGQAWSAATAHAVISLTGLPDETAGWLEHGPPQSAEALKTFRVRRPASKPGRASLTD